MNERWNLVAIALLSGLVGALIGAWLVSGTPAEAQSRRYTNCFFAAQEAVGVDGRGLVQQPRPGHTIVLPAGYEIAGAGASQRAGFILLCR